MKCKIQWIDSQGKETPDNNEAVAITYRQAFVVQHGDHTHEMDESERFPICEAHIAKLREMQKSNPEAHNWIVEPLATSYPNEFVEQLIALGLNMAMELDQAKANLRKIMPVVLGTHKMLRSMVDMGIDKLLADPQYGLTKGIQTELAAALKAAINPRLKDVL
jgi:hypothetical protein